MDQFVKGIVSGLIIIVISGFALYEAIFNDCQADCNALILIAFSLCIMVGINLLMWGHIQWLKASGRWNEIGNLEAESRSSEKYRSPWLISSTRIALSTILLGLPLYWQVSVLTFIGSVGFGLGLNILYRNLIGRVPPSSS